MPKVPRDRSKELDALRESIERGAKRSALRYRNDQGDWVMMAVFPSTSGGPRTVPVMGDGPIPVMERYQSYEEAVAASAGHGALRVNGGWALNVRTGILRRIDPFHSSNHV